MLTNAEMRPERYLRWNVARGKFRWMLTMWDGGHDVLVCTWTRATRLSPKHRDYVRATRGGLSMRSGAKWVSIDYCKLVAE